jgi:hypothetical protein
VDQVVEYLPSKHSPEFKLLIHQNNNGGEQTNYEI